MERPSASELTQETTESALLAATPFLHQLQARGNRLEMSMPTDAPHFAGQTIAIGVMEYADRYSPHTTGFYEIETENGLHMQLRTSSDLVDANFRYKLTVTNDQGGRDATLHEASAIADTLNYIDVHTGLRANRERQEERQRAIRAFLWGLVNPNTGVKAALWWKNNQ